MLSDPAPAHRPLTVTPNQITFARLVLAPVVAALLCVDGKLASFLALALYMVAAISDWLDGYLARKLQLHSTLGRVLDPIADKLLVNGTLLALAYTNRLNNFLVLAGLAIILREVFVAGLREHAALKQQDRQKEKTGQQALPVTNLAKLKTTLQLVALGLLIPAPFLPQLHLFLLGSLLLWLAAALSVYTGYGYWLEVRRNRSEDPTQ